MKSVERVSVPDMHATLRQSAAHFSGRSLRDKGPVLTLEHVSQDLNRPLQCAIIFADCDSSSCNGRRSSVSGGALYARSVEFHLQVPGRKCVPLHDPNSKEIDMSLI
jgi:hypothetical protein